MLVVSEREPSPLSRNGQEQPLPEEQRAGPVAQARNGDAAAWDTLFKRYQLPLYVYVFELVHDEQASLDIVQESFINAARYIEGLEDDEKFGSWLFGIAHQKFIQLWRKRSRESSALEELAEAPVELEDDPAGLLVREEQEGEFMNLLNQVPLPQRSVLLLHFVEDFSLEEIAGITSATLGTVKSRMHYAKKALRKLLAAAAPERRYGAPRRGEENAT
jgi:RNA polymerase sigma-70 factor (ECF subfamily)